MVAGDGCSGVVRSSSSARMDVANVAVFLRSLSAGTSTLLLQRQTGTRGVKSGWQLWKAGAVKAARVRQLCHMVLGGGPLFCALIVYLSVCMDTLAPENTPKTLRSMP